MTCGRTQGFLADHKIVATEIVNASKTRMGAADALALTKGIAHLYAMKGKKVVHVDMAADTPSRDDLLAVLLGPTGNLRAPTVRKGNVLLVGFNEEIYAKILK